MNNPIILIIWWTDGMWAATVRSCAQRGAQVIFVGRSQNKADQIIADIQTQWCLIPVFYPADISQTDSFIQVLNTIISDRPHVSHVFCCAGVHMVASLTDTSLSDRERIMTTNLTSVFVTLQAILPQMMMENYGRVVVMCSDQSLIGKAQSSVYGASKWALWQLVKSTAIDYASHNICINGICPGTIDTKQAAWAAQHFAQAQGISTQDAMQDFAQAQPVKRLWTAEEVAKLATFLLLDNDGYMTWSLYSIDGWLTAW